MKKTGLNDIALLLTRLNEVAGAVMPIVNASRADGLTDAQRQALINEYGLDQDSNLTLRNILRGQSFGLLGIIPGALIGSKKYYNTAKLQPFNNKLLTAGKALSLIGGIASSLYGGSKYTSSNADKIINRNANIGQQNV